MTSKIEIIRQHSLEGREAESDIQCFGKRFSLDPIRDAFRIVLHEDFPMINERDLADFVSMSTRKHNIVISGCKAKEHPYRIMYIDEQGCDIHLAEIPKSIRGNRHWYPEVYQYVPALICIPPNTPINVINNAESFDMYIMPVEKLLDKSCLLERLSIHSLKQTRSKQQR